MFCIPYVAIFYMISIQVISYKEPPTLIAIIVAQFEGKLNWQYIYKG